MHMDFFPIKLSGDHWKKTGNKDICIFNCIGSTLFSYVSRQELNHVYLDLQRLFYIVKSGKDFIHSEMLYHTLDFF